MTLYIGLRNYSDIASGLRVVKGEIGEIPDGHDAEHLVGDVFAVYVSEETSDSLVSTVPEADAVPDIEIDLGADELAQQPNSKRSSKTGT